MGDYIYILLGIAWVAYSLYSARQKALRKQQTSGLPPREPSGSSPLPIPGQGHGKSVFDDILRELTGETRPLTQEIKPDPPQKTVSNQAVPELNQTYQGFSGYKFVSTAEQVSVTNEPDVIQNNQPIDGQMIKNAGLKRNFNLREAVIYSELLNRKNF